MRARERGFTLIEVMVALLIIGMALLGAIKIVGQTAGTSGYMRDKTVAHWVAMNRLTEVRLQKNAPAVDKTSDEVEMGGRKWKWTMNVTQTPIETIRRIDVSVRPEGAPESTEMASVTGFFGTAVAPPGTALIAWQGVADGAPQRPGDKGKDDDEEQDQPNEPPPEESPPEPDPSDGIDPSDPTQQH